jgi:hypothetical protein
MRREGERDVLGIVVLWLPPDGSVHPQAAPGLHRRGFFARAENCDVAAFCGRVLGDEHVSAVGRVSLEGKRVLHVR